MTEFKLKKKNNCNYLCFQAKREEKMPGGIIPHFRYHFVVTRKYFLYGTRDIPREISIPDSKSLLKYRPIFGNYILPRPKVENSVRHRLRYIRISGEDILSRSTFTTDPISSPLANSVAIDLKKFIPK